jgi:hypothetical protein
MTKPIQDQEVDIETLRKAANILQTAHDHIETFGFDIYSYGGIDIVDQVKGHTEIAPACYIGSVRRAAGLPGTFNDYPEEGDGPELIIALKKLDEIAAKRLSAYERKMINQEHAESTTGRFIENLGFEIRDRARDKFPNVNDEGFDEYQTKYALRLLRKALTMIYKDIGND